jgi:hypothetical protein
MTITRSNPAKMKIGRSATPNEAAVVMLSTLIGNGRGHDTTFEG